MAPAGVMGVSGSSAHTIQQADVLGTRECPPVPPGLLGWYLLRSSLPPMGRSLKNILPQHPTSGKRAGGWLAKGFSFCSHLPLGPELE